MVTEYTILEHPYINQITQLERKKKLVLHVVLLIFSAICSYFFLIEERQQTLVELQNVESKLKREFEDKFDLTSNLPVYKQQLVNYQKDLAIMLKMLPTSNQSAAFLEDLTAIRELLDITIQNIHWLPENQEEIYTEYPLDIEVIGDYHSLALFTFQLAKLSRIVTLHNFSLQSTQSPKLRLIISIKMYKINEHYS